MTEAGREDSAEARQMSSDVEAVSAASASQRIPERYDELLAKLAEADRYLDRQELPGRSSHLEEASAIVFDLLYSLDFRQGGELAPRLAALRQIVIGLGLIVMTVYVRKLGGRGRPRTAPAAIGA